MLLKIFSIKLRKKKIPETVLIFIVVLGCLNESAISPTPETSKNINEPTV